MLGDTAVAVHPDDPRYTHLHGKFVILPLIGRRIPVITDGLLVDPKFGTGVVKVTPAHDPNDYATGQRHNLEQINLLTPDGKVNEKGSGTFLGKEYSYIGLKFATAARKQVLADLDSLGLIADKKVHEHEVGHSDRSKTPIEPYLSDQWFVRMGDLADGTTLADGKKAPGLAQAAMDAVIDGRVKITPERYAKSYLDWLGQKRDWCISRQLWWGHRIPVWSRPKWEGENYTEAAVRAYFQKHVLLPALGNDEKKSAAAMDNFTCAYENDQLYICFRDTATESAVKETITKMGYVQDPDVLDTWFSSALWPISTMGWPANGTSDKPEDQLLPYFYPTSVLSTAREILTLWVARMVIFGLYCHGDIPFKDVYIHAVIQDGEGRPMKKSLGNGVDPVDIVASHGADALRFTLASMATETQDIRMPVVKDAKTGINTSPKFDLGRNFANKIWNASRFILTNIDEPRLERRGLPLSIEKGAAALEDRWILSRLNTTIQTVTTSINAYKFADLAEALRSFFWTDLCDWYLEIAKTRIRSGDAVVQSILLHCLETTLKLLHPMMPFITEELWSKLPNRPAMLITTPFPAADASRIDSSAESQLALIQSITSKIRDIQNRYPAAKGKDVILQPRDAATQQTIEQSRTIIEPLAAVKIAENALTARKPENAAAEVLPEVQIYIAGVIDKAVEKPKMEKRRDELTKLATSQRNKLGNEAAIAKVPAAVVQGWRDQLTKYEEELTAIEKNLKELEG